MKVWQDTKDPGRYIFGTADKGKFEVLHPILGGKKAPNKLQMSFPKKAAHKIWNYYPEMKISCSKEIQKEMKEVISERGARRKNIAKIKQQYKDNEVTFKYDTSHMKWPPGDHQKIMYNIVRYTNCGLLGAEAGTQKTGPYLWAVDELMRLGRIKKALIITLSGLKENVLKELKEVQIPHRSAVILEGGKERCSNILNKTFKLQKKNKDYDFYISNYESMFSLVDMFPDDYFDCIICDEGHRLGDPSSRQSKAILEKFISAPYKYIVSGSINSNNIMSHHTPLRFLGEDNVPIVNFVATKRRYMNEVARNIWIENKEPWVREEVARLVGDVGVELKKEDCMDLPGVLTIQRTIAMGTEQKRMTEELKKEFVTTLNNMCDNCMSKHNCDNSCEDKLNGMNALVVVGKLQQIANGYVQRMNKSMDDEGKITEKKIITDIKENPKLILLDAILDEIGDSKVIIWSNSVPTLESLYEYLNSKKKYKGKIVTAWGKDKAFYAAEKFHTEDKIIFLGNPQKAGTGLNMQYSWNMVNFDNSYSFIQYEQKVGRQDRGGQTHRVTVYNLCVEGSIDEVKIVKLGNKEDMSFQLGKFARITNSALQ